MKIVLTDEIRRDFERRFSYLKYQGVEIGLTMKLVLLVPKNVSVRESVLCCLRLAYLLVLGLRHHKRSAMSASKGLGLFLVKFDERRVTRLVFPIMNCFGDNEYNVLSGCDSLDLLLRPNVGRYKFGDVFPRSSFGARMAFITALPVICRRLLGWLRASKLSLLLLFPFAYELAYRFVYVKGANEFLDASRPKFIVADYENSWPWLVLAARARGIPTFNLMHGEIYSAFGWVPLLSDRIVTWGESQKRQLIGFGVDAKRICVCGCPRLERNVEVDRQAICRRLGVGTDKPIALLATNPILWEYREKQVLTFAEALRTLEDVQGLVRLHPVEKLSTYKTILGRCPWIKFSESKDWTVEESISISRVVVNHDSGLGGDALVYGRPVIELDVLPTGLTNGRNLVERAGCPWVKSVDDLRNAIAAICRDTKCYEHYLERAQSFVRDQIFAYGDEAGKNTAAVVRRLCAG